MKASKKERKKERMKERKFPKDFTSLQNLNFISLISHLILVSALLSNKAEGKHGSLTVSDSF